MKEILYTNKFRDLANLVIIDGEIIKNRQNWNKEEMLKAIDDRDEVTIQIGKTILLFFKNNDVLLDILDFINNDNIHLIE